MADVHDDVTRSFNMSQIKSSNTKPELIVRKFLHSKGLRYRLHNKMLPGKPDITLSRFKIVIFVNGCFWHGHEGCDYFRLPKTRTEWWRNKINSNVIRDRKILNELKKNGWNPICVWECDLKPEKRAKTLEDIYYSVIN